MMCSKQFLIVPLLTLIVSAKARQVSEVDALVRHEQRFKRLEYRLVEKGRTRHCRILY